MILDVKKKRRLFILFSVLIVFILGFILVDNILYKPTKLNSFIASKVYKTPANKAFTDDNFYKCVVDAYNKENNTSVAYTESLTDEQLQTIKSLYCSSKKIEGIDGISKLVNVESVDFQNNLINTADISMLNNLDHFNFGDNPLLKGPNLSGKIYLEKDKLSKLELNLKLPKQFEIVEYGDPMERTLFEKINDNEFNVTLSVTYDTQIIINIKNIETNKFSNLDYIVRGYQLNQIEDVVLLNDETYTLTSFVYPLDDAILNNFTVENSCEGIIENENIITSTKSTDCKLTILGPEKLYTSEVNIHTINFMTENYLIEGLNIFTGYDKSEEKFRQNLILEGAEMIFFDSRDGINRVQIFYNDAIIETYNIFNITVEDISSFNVQNLYQKNPYVFIINSPIDKLLEDINDKKIYISGRYNLGTITYGGKYYFKYDYDKQSLVSTPYSITVLNLNTIYEINEEAGYIYTKTDTDANTILSNISLNYGEGKIENNKYYIYYEDELIKSFDIVNVSSEVYKITDDYIYYENGDMLMSNIKVTNATMTTIDNSSHDYKMRIKYNDIVVDELDYVTYYSREYDLTKDYIFGDVNLDLIDTTNLIKEITNNKLVIRYNDEKFKSIDIVKIESDYYLIDNYIYIGSDTFDINKVDVINGNKELKENKLIVKYNNDLLKEYLFKSINFGTLENSNKNIIITEDISYEKFVSNITLSEGLSYKIFNGKDEVTSGNISKGMNLKVYYEEEVIDEYEITDEYLEFDSLLKVDDSKNFISNISLESNVDSLLSKINTSGKVIIKDNKGNAIAGNSLVGTGYKIVVELASDTYEYTLSVKGDVTGTGTSTVSDVAKLYQYLKKKIDMEDCYREAGNVVNIDNEIKINDVAKLYQFIKKKINSLED